MKRMKVLVAVALAMGMVQPAVAAVPTAQALARVVDAHYNHLKSLQCRYTERYQGMGLDRSESGTLTLQKPGRMRWAYDSPAGKVFLLDGQWATSYTPGDAQATRLPEKQLDDLRSPLRFLLGHTELSKELEGLSLTPVSDAPVLYTLRGTPRGGLGQRVQTLALTVDASGQIQSMRIEERDGSATTFTFSGMRENVPTEAGEFRFTPPPGVGVVDGTAPI